MKQQLSTLRPSLVAIAATLVLSATPAFAQTADPSAAPAAAPVTIAPPAPTVAPATTSTAAPTSSAAPVATDQSSNMSAPVDETPTQPVATQSPVVVHTAPSASDAATPKAVTRSATPVAARTSAAPTVATPVSKAAEPAAAAPAPTPAPAPAPVLRDPPPPAAAQTQTKVSSSTTSDDTALYAGLGGAAVLILGGGAFALSRRRRQDEVVYEPVAYQDEPYVAAAPIVATEPSYDTAPAAVVPMTGEAEEMQLANGFDLSRYGPHTRAAYRGPTEDNPSNSLKKRLKVASFRDGRLREAGDLEEGYAAETIVEPGTTREGRKVFGGKLSDRLNFRPGPRASFRPATA